MENMKQNILKVEEGIEDGFDDKLQMTAPERLCFILTTEMNDAINRAK